MENQAVKNQLKTQSGHGRFDFVRANIVLFIGFFVALTVIGAIYFFDLNQSQSLPGVTESRGFKVNFKEAVIVETIHVQSGQKVKKGDILFELSQADLEVIEYENQSQLQQATLELNIFYGKKLDQLTWLAKLRTKEEKSKPLSTLESKFLALAMAQLSLEKKKEKLKVVAPIDGYAGELLVSVGETIAPYRTLIDIFQTKPSIVKSYIPESFEIRGFENMAGSIVRSASRAYEVRGDIVSIGSMLIELPPRFQKDPTNKIYGREIKINLPPNNGFYLGEKVLVSLGEP